MKADVVRANYLAGPHWLNVFLLIVLILQLSYSLEWKVLLLKYKWKIIWH